MKNGKMLLPVLLSIVLICSLILPASAAGASATVPLTDDRSTDHLATDSSSAASAVALNTPQGNVTPMVAAGYVHTVGVRSDGTVVTVGANDWGQDEPSPEVGFANLIGDGKLVIAYNFDPFTTVPTAVNGWTWYDPTLPPAQNNLANLRKNTAYWVKVTEECWFTYGTKTYHLAAGWNNPVWHGSPGDEIVYYEETKIITEEEAENIIEVTEDRSKILFSEATPFVAGIEPGDVLMSEHPVPGAEYGFLERVTGVSNGGKVVEIEPATLEDAIEEGVIVVTETIPLQDLVSNAIWAAGVEIAQVEEGRRFSYNYNPAEGVTIEGYLGVTADAEVHIELSFFGQLQEFEFVFSPGLEMEATLTVEQGVEWEERYSIVTIPGPPIPIWGPVTITPNVELVVGTTGEVVGSLEATVTYDRVYDIGIRYDGSWSTITEVHGEGATLEEPSFSGQAEARVFAGAVLSGKTGISHVVEGGLGAEVLGNIRASGEIETSPWQWQYDLEMYLTAQVFTDLYLCRIAHVGWESDVWQYPDPPYNLAYGASGRVTEGEVGLEGVDINFSGGHSSVTTDPDGYWSKHLLSGEVEATPEKIGYVFDPPNMTITGSASGLDFQAFEEPVVVVLELLNIPSTLTFDKDFVPDGKLEYLWTIFIDIDNNPDTGNKGGSANPSVTGCEVQIALSHFKDHGSTPHEATIIEGTQHNTWAWNETSETWRAKNEIDVTVDYPSNTITMVASRAWEELSNLDENSKFCFHTAYYLSDGTFETDTTVASQGSGVINDPVGDVPHDFIDIVQGTL